MTVDPTFGGGSEVPLTFPLPPGCSSASFTSVNGVVLQNDGKPVVVGWEQGFGCGVGADTEIVVARLTATGALDTTFGASHTGYVQIVAPSNAVRFAGLSVAVSPTGQKLVVGGDQTNGCCANEHVLLARLNTDGTPDTGFGTNGVFIDGASSGDSATALAFDGSGRILTAGDGGDLRRYSGVTPTLDWNTTSFLVGGNGSPGARSIAVQGDGNIVVAGTNYQASTHAGIVARVTPLGAMDPTFGTGGCPNVTQGCTNITTSGDSEYVWSMSMQDAKIVLGGMGNDSGVLLARLTSTGQLDSGFGAGGKVDIAPTGHDASAHAVLYDPYPGIVVFGTATGFDSSTTPVARPFSLDGSAGPGEVTLPDGSIAGAWGAFDPDKQTAAFVAVRNNQVYVGFIRLKDETTGGGDQPGGGSPSGGPPTDGGGGTTPPAKPNCDKQQQDYDAALARLAVLKQALADAEAKVRDARRASDAALRALRAGRTNLNSYLSLVGLGNVHELELEARNAYLVLLDAQQRLRDLDNEELRAQVAANSAAADLEECLKAGSRAFGAAVAAAAATGCSAQAKALGTARGRAAANTYLAKLFRKVRTTAIVKKLRTTASRAGRANVSKPRVRAVLKQLSRAFDRFATALAALPNSATFTKRAAVARKQVAAAQAAYSNCTTGV